MINIKKKILYSAFSKYTTIRSKIRLNKIADKQFEFFETPSKNIIIITIDALRYKNTSLSGYERDTTPFINSLKYKYRGISASPWTYPSVVSLLSGYYPSRHGAYIRGKIKNFNNIRSISPIKKNVITLPEILQALGYSTYIATSIMFSSLPFRNRFPSKVYLETTPAEKLLDDFFRWLSQKKPEKFFAYLHLGDTHEPLALPKGYTPPFGNIERLPNIERWDFKRPEEQKGEKFKKYRKNKVLLYDSIIKYVDGQIEELLYKLDNLSFLDDTLIVITADHGEEFWEHAKLEAENFFDPRGYYGVGHGHNLFNEIIEIPMIFHGFHKLKRNVERICNVDIMPTILKELEIFPHFSLDGFPLQDYPKSRLILTEAIGYGYEKKSLIVEDFKLLYAPDDNVKWLFLLNKNPEEQNPIKDRDIIEIFEDKLKRLLVKLNGGGK